jgi:RNA polymerase sigma-70 factor (ECF subfamily)
MVGNREDARDLTQVTFLNVWRSIGRIDPQRRVSCWIYQVALNQARNALRDRKPRVELSDRVADGGPSPEESAVLAERKRIPQEALLALGESDRHLLVLRYFGQLGLDEMSRVLEVAENTVKSRLFSARQRLGQELMKRGLRSA